ncbi:DEAD/DEAH-box helicase, putative [Candidatus Methylopumilus universalis]|uniref:DrmB family protein n=1 Tax=Candidatus Methylopumilus universalis TaxID=2588536 RepID=UPI003BEEEFC1
MKKPVRRSQAISPFGIGSLVDFPGPTSLIHAGLDAWPIQNKRGSASEFIIEEPRLAKRLGVDYFVLPPDFRTKSKGSSDSSEGYYLKIPFLRFPLWHYCPVCGRMDKSKFHANDAPKCNGPYSTGSNKYKDHFDTRMIQVRFVAACEHGHLQDFPWLEWLRLTDKDWKPDGHNKWLRIRSNGNAGADGVEIIAEERDGTEFKIIGNKRMTGALGGDYEAGESPLTKAGITCSGQNPVLAIGQENAKGCGANLFVILRGASNLYFADVKSSIYIPPIQNNLIPEDISELLEDYEFKKTLLRSARDNDSDGLLTKKRAQINLIDFFPESPVDPDKLTEIFNRFYLHELITKERMPASALINVIKVTGVNKEIISDVIKNSKILSDWLIDPKLLLGQIADWYKNEIGNAKDNNEDEDEISYRGNEYKVFCSDIQEGIPKTNLLIKSSKISEYNKSIPKYFDHISQLHKLRETRAFSGFSRIFAKTLDKKNRKGLISLNEKTWLPAIIVRGEGLFFKFNKDRLGKWEKDFGDFHRDRLGSINNNLEKLRAKRRASEYTVTPKHVLLHTFAHLLINQLIFDCGYGSASLRERIYCSDNSNDDMEGILIYTAAGDSEGTMGGLVKMGLPGLIEPVIARALQKAKWCSADPVCIESKGQGPDSCNLAACHSCALLPETSCEEQNRLLDRAVVIGTLDEPNSGYFNF